MIEIIGTSLNQWDVGRKVKVTAIEADRVHFANTGDSRAVIMEIADGESTIPNYLLQTGKQLCVYAVKNGVTVDRKVFSVQKRERPENYIYEEDQRNYIYELITSAIEATERANEATAKAEHTAESLEAEIKQRVKTVNGVAPDENGNVVVQGGNGGVVEETDPTVPAWAKQPEKPTYTAEEVGALPASTVIPTVPTKVSAFENDSGYLTEVPAGYAKTEDIPTKAEDIGAQPAGNYLTEVPSGYATEEFVTNKIAEAELGGEEVDLSGYAQKSELPTKVSQLANDAGFITGYTETDPTVPSWAKQPQKPSYTASEVGALPNTTKIPSKTSDLTNDSGFIAGYTESDPTVPAWAKASSKPSYSKSEVGLGNVDNVKQYSASNPPPYPVTSVNGKTGAVNLDAAAVGARPSSWMPSASDVGALPASTTIPTKVSQLTNDKGYLTEHQDLSAYAKKTDIPTNDQINSLIDAKLGVIENGTY